MARLTEEDKEALKALVRECKAKDMSDKATAEHINSLGRFPEKELQWFHIAAVRKSMGGGKAGKKATTKAAKTSVARPEEAPVAANGEVYTLSGFLRKLEDAVAYGKKVQERQAAELQRLFL